MIRENLNSYEEKILKALSPFKYQKERYNVGYTLAVGATVEAIDMSGFSQIIRETDAYVPLDEHVAVVIFAFNDQEQGIKAASNLLSKFEMQYFTQKIYLGIINAEEEEQSELLVKKLFETLCYSLVHGMSNQALDFEAINDHKAAM